MVGGCIIWPSRWVGGGRWEERREVGAGSGDGKFEGSRHVRGSCGVMVSELDCGSQGFRFNPQLYQSL